MATMFADSLRSFLKPVLPYLDDDGVSEIMINGPTEVWVERKGRITRTEAAFSEEGLMGAARNLAQFVGRTLSEERPRLDARLPDGSRIHVVLPPIARRGTTISIRKFFKEPLGTSDLVRFGSLTPPMVRIIEAAIDVKLNVMVAGGTGSGKTTLLNVLSSLIGKDERIVTIEDSAELQLTHPNLVSLETRPADKHGKGEVSMTHLLQSSLRLRPDRIIVGEVRGGEAFDLIQAMNTGHGGSLTTVHANTPVDTLRRLESLCLMSSVELPMVAVRAQIASAIGFVVICERLKDGSRKVIALSEVLPLSEKGDYRTQDIWLYAPVAKDDAGQILGYHGPTGVLPSFLAKARAHGFADLDEAFFDPATYGLPPPPLIHGVGELVTTHWAPSLKHRERNEADPERFKTEWRAFEARLKEEARARAAAKPQAPATTASPSSAPPQRSTGRMPSAPANSGAVAAGPQRSTGGALPAVATGPQRATQAPPKARAAPDSLRPLESAGDEDAQGGVSRARASTSTPARAGAPQGEGETTDPRGAALAARPAARGSPAPRSPSPPEDSADDGADDVEVVDSFDEDADELGADGRDGASDSQATRIKAAPEAPETRRASRPEPSRSPSAARLPPPRPGRR